MTLEQNKTYYYRVGGNLPPNAPSYVKREADKQLYQKLKSGEFCYVLNSRQMGKSSLWVRVKQRLEREDYICAAIDLSGIGQGEKKQWYASFANRLTKSFDPSVKKQWRSWRKEAEYLELSPIEKLHQLIEELLLPSLLPHQKLVIFIDEIDYVKGLSFSTDEFFALIRSCYNERSLNPQFNQVTFCLLGVATPADLIENKQLTPFNIGTGIKLEGLSLDEAAPLIAGLKGTVSNAESVISEIIAWTGGQPFLTQRLCSLVLGENNPTPDISKLVYRQIIDNWETQDEQEHLRTIQNRILSNEQRAGYLLELYRQVLQQGQIPLNNSSEERELQLSGLVVKRNNALEVFNPIYAKVFNEAWLDLELVKLRPYEENYRAWIASNKKDSSRLLRGKALEEAKQWARGKTILNAEDREFLAACYTQQREEKIAVKEQEAELARETTKREAAEEAKRIEAEANRKARRRLNIGSVVLIITFFGAAISAGFAIYQVQEAFQAKTEANKAIKQQQEAEAKLKYAQQSKDEAENALTKANKALRSVRELSLLASKLRKNGKVQASDEALRKAGLSTLIDNKDLKQAWLMAATAEAYTSLEDKGRDKALAILNELIISLDFINNNNTQYNSKIANQIRAFVYFQFAKLKDKKNFQDAYDALKASKLDLFDRNIEIDLLNEQNVENIYWELIKFRKIDINSSNEIAESFREYLYSGLEFLLKRDSLQKADLKTYEIMLYFAQRKKEGNFTAKSIENFSCTALGKIDSLWYAYPKKPKHFGFHVQKEIWQKNGSPTLNSSIEKWRQFYIDLGWKWDKSGTDFAYGYFEYENLSAFNSDREIEKGNLPWFIGYYRTGLENIYGYWGIFFSRTESCNLQ